MVEIKNALSQNKPADLSDKSISVLLKLANPVPRRSYSDYPSAALNELAKRLDNGKVTDEADIEEIVKVFRAAAEQHNAKAQYYLGMCYAKGIGVPQDKNEAYRLDQLAANQGYAPAQRTLGMRYSRGLGVPQDDKEAARLLQLAVNQGDGTAQCDLGWCYAKGKGVQEDRKEALKLFQLAVKQGSAQAQFNLAIHFTLGDGVPEDHKEAVRLFRLSANQGFMEAQTRLADYLEHGQKDVKQDHKEAVQLYLAIADKGGEQGLVKLKEPKFSDALKEIAEELILQNIYSDNPLEKKKAADELKRLITYSSNKSLTKKLDLFQSAALAFLAAATKNLEIAFPNVVALLIIQYVRYEAKNIPKPESPKGGPPLRFLAGVAEKKDENYKAEPFPNLTPVSRGW